MKKIFVTIVAFILAFSQIVIAKSDESTIDYNYFKTMIDFVKNNYKGNVDESKLIEGAIKGIFDSLDTYTTYFTSEQANSFMEKMDGKFKGIGIMMIQSGDYISVSKVIPSSPAQKSGILAGDKIIEVDGKSIEGMSTDQVVALIRGEQGTNVRLTILRSGSSDNIVINITREEIVINPVTYETIGDIGYIKLEIFNENLTEFLDQALKEFDKENITKVILDLRDNPGGEVNEVIDVANRFIPEGLVTKIDYKADNLEDNLYYSKLKQMKYNIAVLVNGMSASASEILAGAVQDRNAGVLIGTKTYGKGKVQTMKLLLTPAAQIKYKGQLGKDIVDAEDLINNYGIMPSQNETIGWAKMTIGEYTTPSGKMIDKVGLTPDIVIENPQNNNGYITTISKLTKTTKPKLNFQSLDVYNAEAILKLMNYEVDTPDFMMDQKTVNAVAKFQKDMGMFPYGVLDFSTQQKLNEKFNELRLKLDLQLSKAVEALNS